jgi:hypothetical protein
LTSTLMNQLPDRSLTWGSTRTTQSIWTRAHGPLNRTARWATVVVPLSLAVPALSIGAFTSVHVAASNAKTPCTARIGDRVIRNELQHGTQSYVIRIATGR